MFPKVFSIRLCSKAQQAHRCKLYSTSAKCAINADFVRQHIETDSESNHGACNGAF